MTPLPQIYGDEAQLPPLHRDVQDLITELHRRSAFYRRIAVVAQGFVAASIVGGLALFYYTQTLETLFRDQAIYSKSLTIHKESTLRKEVEDNVRALGFEARSIANPRAGEPVDTIRLRQVNDKIQDAEADIARRKKVEAALSKERDEILGQTTDRMLLIVATKIGGVLLILYFIRVLVVLLKYYWRLSVFYQSRADSLRSYRHITTVSLLELSQILSPDAIDMEKTPDPPDPSSLAAQKDSKSSPPAKAAAA